jgi:hypothetical protein
MTVTPAVSADRRYVRLSVDAYFNVVNGFSSFTTPLGAVSGSGGGGLGGGGMGGGLGGMGGGLGGVGGGLRSVGGFGPIVGSYNAGMNGVIGPTGLDGAMGFAQVGFVDQLGEIRAGTLPNDGGYEYVMSASAAPVWLGGTDGDLFLTGSLTAPAPLISPARSREEVTGTGGGKKPISSRELPETKTAARHKKAQAARASKSKAASDEEPVIKPKAKTTN